MALLDKNLIVVFIDIKLQIAIGTIIIYKSLGDKLSDNLPKSKACP